MVDAFLDTDTNGPQVLLLEGEAGIGKTSVWKKALSAARDRGFRVLSSAPTEAESGLPYAALGDLLNPVPEEAIALLSPPLRASLEVALFRAPAEQAPTDKLAVSSAFLKVLRGLAAEVPVLIAVDDIQWMDAPSMQVLAYAVHRLDGEELKLITAARVPAATDVAADLRKAVGDPLLQRLELQPLGANAIDDLLLQELDHPLPRTEVQQVYAASAGNPFFALEIGRFLLSHRAERKAGEPIPLPRSLTDAIKGRITTLPDSARHVLTAMAALSRPDEAVLQRADRGARAALEAAYAAQVIEFERGRLRFTHPLLASVAYSMAEPATRRRWHSKLADAVEDPEEKARHLALAATGPDASVADALDNAARSANSRGASDTAAALAQQAANLTPRELGQATERRLVMTAEYRLRAGDAPGARQLLEAVLRTLSTGTTRAEALRLMGSITFASGDLNEMERLLVQALSEARDDLRVQALIERDLILAFNQRGKFQESAVHCDRLSELAAQSQDLALLAHARRQKAFTGRHFRPLTAEEHDLAVSIAEGAVSADMDESTGGLHPLMDWGVLLKWSNDFGHARAAFRRALTMTEGRDESMRTPILFHLAELECWSGDWLLAAVYAHECEKAAIHAGLRSYARLHLAATALLDCCRGEYDAAKSAAAEVLAISTEIGDEPYRRRGLWILGAAELAAGDPAAANRHFETLRARGHLQVFRGNIRSEGDEVEALIALGRLGEAQQVCDRLAAFSDPWQCAIGARCRALVEAAQGKLDASIQDFDHALRAHEQLSMPLEKARSLLGYATVLRRAKQKRAARDRLEEALGIFRSLGAKGWIKRAESELERIAPAAASIGALTPTEAKVAELVRNGATNKEVAAELFMSVKTVEANLSRIYEKLGVRSRSELAARAASHHAHQK